MTTIERLQVLLARWETIPSARQAVIRQVCRRVIERWYPLRHPERWLCDRLAEDQASILSEAHSGVLVLTRSRTTATDRAADRLAAICEEIETELWPQSVGAAGAAPAAPRPAASAGAAPAGAALPGAAGPPPAGG